MFNSKTEERPSRATKTDRADERPTRIPVSGNRNILTMNGKEDGYVYRWVNDMDGRIERFKQAGYEFVAHEIGVGDKTADTGKGTSSVISKDVGSGITAYAMRIKKEWYDEDQAAKAQAVAASEESMFRALNKQEEGSYGEVTLK